MNPLAIWTPTQVDPSLTTPSGTGKTIAGGRTTGKFVYGGYEWTHATNVHRRNPAYVE